MKHHDNGSVLFGVKDVDGDGGGDGVDPFFGGTQRNVVRCGECGAVSFKRERFTEIALSMERREPIQGGDHEEASGLCAEQLILDHFGAERLEGENKYFCSECGHKVVAERTIEIVHAPKHLMLCFKRFSWNLKTMKRLKLNEVRSLSLSLWMNAMK